jgi:hypothetical protein
VIAERKINEIADKLHKNCVKVTLLCDSFCEVTKISGQAKPKQAHKEKLYIVSVTL